MIQTGFRKWLRAVKTPRLDLLVNRVKRGYANLLMVRKPGTMLGWREDNIDNGSKVPMGSGASACVARCFEPRRLFAYPEQLMARA